MFGDCRFVHRLIQNVVDGKLVELPDTEGDATSSENVPSQVNSLSRRHDKCDA